MLENLLDVCFRWAAGVWAHRQLLHLNHVLVCWLSRNILWLSRNIGCFTRDIRDFLTCSCSATIVKLWNVVTKRRSNKAKCYDWATLLWLNRHSYLYRWSSEFPFAAQHHFSTAPIWTPLFAVLWILCTILSQNWLTRARLGQSRQGHSTPPAPDPLSGLPARSPTTHMCMCG